MKYYAVIGVDQCYDDVQGVESLFVSTSEAQCQAWINAIKLDINEQWKKIGEYTNKFVDDIVVPTDNSYWEWVKQYPVGNSCSPNSFKASLKYNLMNGHSTSNYNPPPKHPQHNYSWNLHIVELEINE